MACARRGASMFIRPLEGLKAVEEAIGRATEMGRPSSHIPGLGDMSEVSTPASITILMRLRGARPRWGAISRCWPRPGGGDDHGRRGAPGLRGGRPRRLLPARDGPLRERPAVRLRRRRDRLHVARAARDQHLHGRLLRRVALPRRDGESDRRHPDRGHGPGDAAPSSSARAITRCSARSCTPRAPTSGASRSSSATIAAQDWAKALAAALVVVAAALAALGHPEAGRLLQTR